MRIKVPANAPEYLNMFIVSIRALLWGAFHKRRISYHYTKTLEYSISEYNKYRRRYKQALPAPPDMFTEGYHLTDKYQRRLTNMVIAEAKRQKKYTP